MIVGEVVVHLCLTLIIKELKFSVQNDRVVTTLNIIFSVVSLAKATNPSSTRGRPSQSLQGLGGLFGKAAADLGRQRRG